LFSCPGRVDLRPQAGRKTYQQREDQSRREAAAAPTRRALLIMSGERTLVNWRRQLAGFRAARR
jgi:hypothetical protein